MKVGEVGGEGTTCPFVVLEFRTTRCEGHSAHGNTCLGMEVSGLCVYIGGGSMSACGVCVCVCLHGEVHGYMPFLPLLVSPQREGGGILCVCVCVCMCVLGLMHTYISKGLLE